MRRWLIAAVVAIALLLVVFTGVVMVTQTDWGRAKVRGIALELLQDKTHGIVRMGRLGGNLLKGFTVDNLSIRDSAGGLFLSADEVRFQYGMRALLSKKLVLSNITLVRPVIILDKQPGGSWNYRRLYPRSTTPKDPNAPPGFGDWIRFEDVEIVAGRFIVRNPWSPDTALSPAQRDSVVADHLGGGSRLVIRRVPGGFQKVTDLRAISGRIPLFRLKDPDEKTKRLEIATMQMAAALFHPPIAEVRDLRGAIEFRTDSIWFEGVKLVMPGSRADVSGKYMTASEDLTLRVKAERVAFTDLQWIYPRLPSDGHGSMDFAMAWRDTASTYVARDANVVLGDARASGTFGITDGDRVTRFHDTNVRFSRLDTRTIEQLVPGFASPRRGTLGGHVVADGTMAAMRVDADVWFDDVQSGRSRVVAAGLVGTAGGVVSARGLRLTLAPLQVNLARKSVPDLPVGGTISGRATLDGSTTTRFVARGDFEHLDRGERSRIVGTAAFRAGRGIRTWIDVDVRAEPVSLVTIGRFMPAVGLHGSASGPVRLTGTLDDLGVRSSLQVAAGGVIEAGGRLGFGSGREHYDLAVGMQLFNANAVIAKLPRTSVTATMRGTGTGFDPATMRATFAADMETSDFDSVKVDTALVRLRIADGMLHADTVRLHAPYGTVVMSGSFGLVAGRDGELTYRVAVDSLQALERWIPADSGVVQPRPAVIARAVARARADSAVLDEETAIEREISGERAPSLAVDTPGVVRGNLTRFDLRGRGGIERLAIRGNTVEDLRAEYAWLNARTPQSSLVLGADMRGVRAGGFLLDSAEARLTHGGGRGSAEVAIHQDDERDYSAGADFVLHEDHNELHLNRLRLRFDTTFWASTQPAAIRWGASGIELKTIELRNGERGRIYVNGLLPTEGVADLEIAVTEFEIGNVWALLQSDLEMSGLVTLTARVRGTMTEPEIAGAVGATNFSWRGATIPELHGTVNYAGRRATGRVELVRDGGAPMVVASGTVPVNLALRGVDGSRLGDGELTLDIVADSLPLELIPRFTDAVTNVRGRAAGSIAVRGTMRAPQVAGALLVDRGRATIVPLGISVTGITGSVRMMGDTVVIDSLVGSSDGAIRLEGGLGVASLLAPSFDLRFTTRRARVMDNELGRVRADANVSMAGPFNKALVSGNVRVRSGVLYIPPSRDKHVISSGDPALFNVIDTSVVAYREIFAGQSPLLKNLRVEVNLRVDRDTWVRSQEANVEVYSVGDLIVMVDRATDALALDGVLNSDRGEYTFMSKRFQIKRGSATFIGSPELNPTLQLTGEYEVRLPAREALHIRLLIGGTLESPRLTLESDAQPPISQSDLLSYLAFGRSSSTLLQIEGSGVSGGTSSGNLVGATAALASSQLAGVAVGVMANEFESEAARSLGADVFNITPADLQTEIWHTDVAGFLLGTEIEYGKYWNPRNFIGVQARPLMFIQPGDAPPGLRYQHRDSHGFTVEATFESRFRLRSPSLGEPTPKTSTVFGLFLIREWRF